MEIAIGIILIAASLFLIFAVLMQSGKSKKLSGTIAGGAETFFGKTKGKSIDKTLSKLTTIIAIVFVLLVLILILILIYSIPISIFDIHVVYVIIPI